MNRNLNILVFDSDKNSLLRTKDKIKTAVLKDDKVFPVQNIDLLDHVLRSRKNDIIFFSFSTEEAFDDKIKNRIEDISDKYETMIVYDPSIKDNIDPYISNTSLNCLSYDEITGSSLKIILSYLRKNSTLKRDNLSLNTKLKEYLHGINDIIHDLREPIIIIDSNNRVLFSNSIADRIFKTGDKQIKGSILPLDLSNNNTHINIKNEILSIDSQVRITSLKCSEIPLFMITFETSDVSGKSQNIEYQKKFFQSILDALPYPMYLKDSEGVYRKCNIKYCEFLGKTMDEIIGSTIYELMPSEFSTKCTLSDSKVLATNVDIKYRIDYINANKKNINVMNHKSVFEFPNTNLNGIVGLLIDITDYIQVQKKLKLNEEKFRALFQFSNDAIIIHTFDQTIVDVNQKATKMFDYDYYELTHSSIDELDKLKLYKKYLDEAVENGFSRYDTTFISRFGKDIDVEVSICVIDYDKKLVHSNIRLKNEKIVQDDSVAVSDSFFDVIFNTSDDAIFIEDEDSVIIAANKAASKMFGYTVKEMLQLKTSDLQPEHIKVNLKSEIREDGSKTIAARTIGITKNRNLLDIEVKTTRVIDKNSIIYISVIRDVSDKAELEGKIIETIKIENNWNLVKNIADNFSTPAQIIINNTGFISNIFKDISENIKQFYYIINNDAEMNNSDRIKEILRRYDEFDLLALLQEIPDALTETEDGVKKISSIINAVKEISIPEKDAYTYYNVNKLIENALLLAQSEHDCNAETITEFDEKIPFTIGFPSQLNDVFLTLFRESIKHLSLINPAKPVYLKVTTEFMHTFYEIKIKHYGICSSPDVYSFMNSNFMNLYGEDLPVNEQNKSSTDYGNPFTAISKIITINHKGNFYIDLTDADSTLYQIKIPLKSSENDTMIEKL